MLDHSILFKLFNVQSAYERMYYISFAIMVLVMTYARRKYAWDESAFLSSTVVTHRDRLNLW